MGAINRLSTLRRSLRQNLCIDLAGNDVIFIAGSGRSGTSWLANICNYRNSFRYLFEPLNPRHLPERYQPFKWCANIDDKHEPLGSVIAGKSASTWSNSRNTRLIANRRLIKEIRANLLLPWINVNQPEVKTLLLMRNPLAVAASRKALAYQKEGNWVWEPSLRELLDEPALKAQLSNEEYQLLSLQVDKGVVLETIADWCINNLVASRLIDFTKTYLIFYEDMVSRQDMTVRSLMNFIEVGYHQNIETFLSRKSETTRSSNNVAQPTSSDDVANQWQQVLTPQEIVSANELLNSFEIERFYTADFVPQMQY